MIKIGISKHVKKALYEIQHSFVKENTPELNLAENLLKIIEVVCHKKVVTTALDG